MDKTTYLIELSGSPRTAFGKTDFSTQQEEQKVFSAIWSLESQVNNGGFKQYFESWDGETANFAPADKTALQALDSLDSEFFAYPDDLAELLFEYVAARPKVFGPVPNE